MADDDRKGIMSRLPKLRTHDWGTLGPAFGYGIGCGVGFGAGIVGGSFGVLARLVFSLFIVCVIAFLVRVRGE